ERGPKTSDPRQRGGSESGSRSSPARHVEGSSAWLLACKTPRFYLRLRLDDDGPPERRVFEMQVIVKAARARRVQVRGLAALAGRQVPDRVEFGAVGMFRMRIAVHLMDDRGVVDECHLGSRLHGQPLRIGASGRER